MLWWEVFAKKLLLYQQQSWNNQFIIWLVWVIFQEDTLRNLSNMKIPCFFCLIFFQIQYCEDFECWVR